MGCFLWELSLTLVCLFSVDVNIMSGLKLLFLPGPEKKGRVLCFFLLWKIVMSRFVLCRIFGQRFVSCRDLLYSTSWFLLRRVVGFLSLYLYIFISGLLFETQNLLTLVSNSESMATVFGLATHG